ncbi:MAG: cyclic-di-AMP phosphodiesterase PgpH [Blastocatellia bacterium]|nr:cyclic-di-AMP phosphodiesterase PgpH [Blastocatellia bacterium]
MNPRPRFTSRLARVRNAVLGFVLRPFRWFSGTTQFVFGFVMMVIATSALLVRLPLTVNSIGIFLLTLGSYFVLWRFVESRDAISLSISKRRAFALAGSAVVFQTAVMRFGFLVATGLAAQSTRAPLNEASVWAWTIPFAAASLLVTMLLNRQLGLVTGVITALFAGLLATNGAPAALYAFISCSAAVYGIKRYCERQSVTLAGLVVAGINGITAVALIAFAQPHLTVTGVLVALGCAIAGGLLTIIFAAGGVPINESMFGILTDIRLLELSNADLPVLTQLALRAPGTNQHSVAVGQLAEDACRAIGANALLARIGSLYHDIGKVAAPDHFVENQMGRNPHDRLRPLQSAKIITSHVTYGLKLANEIGLPQRVADFIPQHHGTRTLHFFLQKARAENGKEVNEAEFRYPGPRPQFKESAILMLADSAEAAARSLARPDPASVEAIVARIFEAIISDGQLDESTLTLRELKQIREALIASLNALYHPRIDYPGFNVPAEAAGAMRDTRDETRGVTYQQASDVPINRSGEVEDEAISR